LRHTNLFDELPPQYYDSAFLDRLHFYIPGWEVEVIRGEMFSEGYGFILDYLAEILRNLRNLDYSQKYQGYFELSPGISTRDRDGINKTFSGLMKILFPNGNASKEDMEKLLAFAGEGRKRVKDQLMRIDTTYPEVTFKYTDLDGNKEFPISTKEESEYPQYYFIMADAASPRKEIKTNENVKKIEPPSLTEEEKLISNGENAKLEFKATLRWNLETKQFDKQIEHSALKTIVAFLNTEGGTLLIGVKDDGEILGLKADKFPNEDKYLLHFANLINEKIGKQHVNQIKYGLKPIDENKVLRIDCKPSSTPVFLTQNGSEEFFVRNGPSSVNLSSSEVLEYCKKHFS
jgi:hypothetical protein